ncbi:hypothetical protein GCM10027269_55290 [Kribbella endophytica]
MVAAPKTARISPVCASEAPNSTVSTTPRNGSVKAPILFTARARTRTQTVGERPRQEFPVVDATAAPVPFGAEREVGAGLSSP